MVIAFQVTLILAVIISIIGIIADSSDAPLRSNMTIICTVSIAAFLTTFFIV